MSEKLFDYKVLYSDETDFFDLNGNCCMYLSSQGAIAVCHEATKRNLSIGMIEGGHWLNPGFRPDMHTRWDGFDRLTDKNEIKKNNDNAVENIKEDTAMGYDAFIITIVGYSQ